jgi:poly(3-hydroxybutyrate) depolymerase
MPADNELPPGDHDLFVDHDGVERVYTLHVPPEVRDPPPLLVVLHGGTLDRRFAALGSTTG